MAIDAFNEHFESKEPTEACRKITARALLDTPRGVATHFRVNASTQESGTTQKGTKNLRERGTVEPDVLKVAVARSVRRFGGAWICARREHKVVSRSAAVHRHGC